MDNLPITKEEFLSGILPFVEYYKRLPYMREDKIEVIKYNEEKEEDEIKIYTAAKYIEIFFESQDNLTDYLFENNIIEYSLVSEMVKIKEKRLRELLDGSAKKVEKSERRAVEIFFNNDFYEDLGKYADLCSKCSVRKCKHDYWITVVSCQNYKKKK